MNKLFPKFTLFLFLFRAMPVELLSVPRESLSSAYEEAEKRIEAENDFCTPLVAEERRQDPLFFARLDLVLREGTVTPIAEGSGGTYLAADAGGKPVFVIKPCDEQPGCLHNPKGFGSPLEIRIKEGIAPYRSARTEVFCRKLAELCGIEKVVPETKLCFLRLPPFFSVRENPKAKLCSVQEYLEESLSLFSFLRTFLMQTPDDDLIEREIDQESFAAASLLTWLTLDNDAHFDNFRLRRKRDRGTLVYEMKKIDGSICFPDTNTGFFNALALLPNAQNPLSLKIRTLIRDLPVESIKTGMRTFGLDSSVEPFEERVFLLRRLAENPSMTYSEVSLHLGFPDSGPSLFKKKILSKEFEVQMFKIFNINNKQYL